MCIVFPGLVVAIDPDGATIQTERGRRRRASTLYLPEVGVGDWVTVAAGTIVDRLDPAEAEQIRHLVGVATLDRPDPDPEGAPDVHAS